MFKLNPLTKALSRHLWRDSNKYPVYFDHPKLRITLFNRGANEPPKLLRKNEVIISRDSWYPIHVASYIKQCCRKFHPDPKRIIFLSNTEEIHRERLRYGLNSHYINIGCFVDDTVFTPAQDPETKIYDAVMVARFALLPDGQEMKRHFLALKVPRLALVDPVFESRNPAAKKYYTSQKNCIYSNSQRLPKKDVVQLLHRSHCGLILSKLEGICRASSEYLLCGIPVVSTPSTGGRDVWYDEYNSIIVEPNEDRIAAAVAELVNNPRDPWRIRQGYREKAQVFRNRFCNDVLTPILKQHEIEMSAQDVMVSHPFRWWGPMGKEPLVPFLHRA